MVKYTCKIIQQKWREGGRAREWRADKSAKDSEKEGGQREKQGLSQVVHSAKQVLDKHTESKQSQSTVIVARLNQIKFLSQ